MRGPYAKIFCASPQLIFAKQILFATLATMNVGIDKVLKAAEQSPSKVAARLHSDDRPCQRQHVEYWIKQGYVPPSWAPLVSQEFDVPLHELNGTVYPAPKRASARH